MQNAETAIPQRDKSGLKFGNSASSPASIPAAGTSDKIHTIPSAAGAAFLKRKRIAPRYPPWRLPTLKNKHTSAAKMTEEITTGRKNCFPRKKRTSSVPDIKPAPMLVPTIKNVARSILIALIYYFYRKNMTNLHKNV